MLATERHGGKRNWCAFFYPAGARRLGRVHCHDSSSVYKPARDDAAILKVAELGILGIPKSAET
jgi:hypothetical protein